MQITHPGGWLGEQLERRRTALSLLGALAPWLELGGLLLGLLALVNLLVSDVESFFDQGLAQAAAAVLGVGILAQLAALPHSVETRLRRVEQSVETRLREVEQNVQASTEIVKRVTDDLHDVVHLPTKPEFEAQQTHPRAYGIINSVVRGAVWDDVRSAVSAYQEVTKEGTLQATFRQPAQAYAGLLGVLDALEPGACWFGVTRIQDVQAWNSEWLPAFTQYREQLQDRLDEGRIHVFRVYSLDDDPTPAQLQHMATVAAGGVRVAYVTKAQRDVTAIYEPRQASDETTTRAFTETLTQHLTATQPDRFHRELDRLDYRPEFGIEFRVDRSVLWRVDLHSDDNKIRSLLGEFAGAWQGATPIVAAR